MGQVFGRDVAVLRDGFATPFRIDDRTTIRGCLYSADGARLALSQRHFGPGFRFRPGDPDTIDPATVASAPRLDGRTLYLGHYMPHYGHFLTETLSTFWILETRPAAAFDRVAFHPCFFGRLSGYARQCLAAFGIAPEAVVLLDAEGTGGPVRFEEVVVPERLFRLWDSADPLLRGVFDRIRGAALAGRAPAPGRDVYLSRRRSYWRGGQRVVANEGLVEEMFRRRGFLIVNPETVAFPDQVALYAAAPTLAGLSGSALLNCLFQRPGARLLELEHPDVYDDDLPVSTQVLCNAVAGVAGSFVPFTGRRRHGATVLHLDLAGVAAVLPAVTAPPSPPAARLAAALEVAALDLLPPTRAAARRVGRVAHRVAHRATDRATARAAALRGLEGHVRQAAHRTAALLTALVGA